MGTWCPARMEEITDPEELAKARAQRERFDLQQRLVCGAPHATEAYRVIVAKCVQSCRRSTVRRRHARTGTSAEPRRPILTMMAAFRATFPAKNWTASMREFDGEWLLCDDGILRPVIRGEIPRECDGTWQRAEFLVDTGADRTVLSAPVLASLRPPPVSSPSSALGGVGGEVDSGCGRNPG